MATDPGVAGCGLLGIGLEVLAPPVQSALATATTGGTITAGTYRYVVTAINEKGETTASNEQTIVTTGSTSTVTVTWATVTGATGYKLYKTAAGGATGTELLYKTVGVVTSDVDTSPGTPTGAFPSTNTASNPGVYVPPTAFIPIRSESLTFQQETTWRRSIRKSVDFTGVAAGNTHVEGDVVFEAQGKTAVYFHKISRASLVKTGSGPYTYKFSNNCGALAPLTASFTIERNGEIFGYTGCNTGQFQYSNDNGTMLGSYSIIGSDEATQTAPTVTWPTGQPFGNNQIAIEVPTATAVFTVEDWEFTVNDNAEPQFRVKNTGVGAQYVRFGEREVTLSLTKDFLTKAEYALFKALTAQSITVAAAAGAETMKFKLPASIIDTYGVELGGQGDGVMAEVEYNGTVDGTGQSYEVEIVTTENV